MTSTQAYEHRGYGVGHCWYYKLGGEILYPKNILERARDLKYRGYRRHTIDKASGMSEPQRSEALRHLRTEVVAELRRDLARYREVVCQLTFYRQTGNHVEEQGFENDVFLAVSLKVCHLTNDFAHLIEIDKALDVQRDLFVGI